MKKITTLLSILLLITSCNQARSSQTQTANDKIETVCEKTEESEQYPCPHFLLIDLDNDQIKDSVFFDSEREIIIVKLSSQQFRPIKNQQIRGNYCCHRIFETESGFGFEERILGGGSIVYFQYNSESNRIQVVRMRYFERSGESSVNLLTGEYISNWVIFGNTWDEMWEIPTIRAEMSLGTVYLEDFCEEIWFGFGAKSYELVTTHRERFLQQISHETIDISVYDEEYTNSEITEFPLNEHYSIRIRQISESEFNAQKEASEHLRHHNNYKVIRDIDEARELLGDRFRGVQLEGTYPPFYYRYLEVIHNDGVTRLHNMFWCDWGKDREWSFFDAYYPELGIVLLNSDGIYVIDLNDSTERDFWQMGDPAFHNLSPNRQWRLNGFCVGDTPAGEGSHYFLEKWNPKKERFEFVGDFENSPDVSSFAFATDLRWISNSKLIFEVSWHWRGRFFEMEIIGK